MMPWDDVSMYLQVVYKYNVVCVHTYILPMLATSILQRKHRVVCMWLCPIMHRTRQNNSSDSVCVLFALLDRKANRRTSKVAAAL
jgi:hypothetical protein